MRWLLLGLALVGCAADSTLWITPPPGRLGARSTVMIFEDEGLPTFLLAAEVSDGELLAPIRLDDTPWSEEPAKHPQVTAIAYDLSLADLELPPGILPGTTTPRQCALLAPSALSRTAVEPGEAALWVPGEAILSPSHRALLVADDDSTCALPDHCPEVTTTNVPLTSIGNTRFIIGLDDHRALLGTTNPPSIQYVTSTVATAVPALSGKPSEAAFLTRDGELWLGGVRGKVEYGRLGTKFESVPITEAPEDSVAVISVQEDPRVVMVLTGYIADETVQQPHPPEHIGVFLRENDTWRKIFGAEVRSLSHASSSIIWTGVDEALITYRDYDVLRYKDGAIIDHGPISGDAAVNVRIESMARHPTLGVYFGGDNGRVYGYQADVDDYRQIDGVAFLSSVEGLFPYADGFFMGGVGGRLAQFYPGYAPCDDLFGAAADASEFGQVGRDVLVSGGNIDRTRLNSVTWLFVR